MISSEPNSDEELVGPTVHTNSTRQANIIRGGNTVAARLITHIST